MSKSIGFGRICANETHGGVYGKGQRNHGAARCSLARVYIIYVGQGKWR